MKEIPLTQGKVALVDDDMFEYLNQWKWFAIKGKHTFYAVRTDNKNIIRIWMHREIVGKLGKEIFTDHADQNGCNNQRSNLRKATRSQNKANARGHKNSSSIYKGVSWREDRKRWNVRITKDGVTKGLGLFKNEVDAAFAYNNAAKNIYLDFASLNII